MKVKTLYTFDITVMFDLIEGLEVEVPRANRLIRTYLENEFANSGFIVPIKTHQLVDLTDPYYRYVESKLRHLPIQRYLDATCIPVSMRSKECTIMVADYQAAIGYFETEEP